MICFIYPKEATKVSMRMATSLISPEQAKVSLDRELSKEKGFVFTMMETKNVWNK
jgi:putative alpha-1,2-mannosidase